MKLPQPAGSTTGIYISQFKIGKVETDPTETRTVLSAEFKVFRLTPGPIDKKYEYSSRQDDACAASDEGQDVQKLEVHYQL